MGGGLNNIWFLNSGNTWSCSNCDAVLFDAGFCFLQAVSNSEMSHCRQCFTPIVPLHRCTCVPCCASMFLLPCCIMMLNLFHLESKLLWMSHITLIYTLFLSSSSRWFVSFRKYVNYMVVVTHLLFSYT